MTKGSTQRVKEIIKEIAEKEGWVAETEYAGSSSSGDRWVADVLAVKGEYKIAFEIQLSPQQFAYYRTRQQRYRESGIKCLWLSTTIPQLSDQEIPIFGISRSGGVFVVDFPDFFQPDILKLPVGFTGASLGEFVHLMLERAVLWEPEWVKKHDELARLEDWLRLPQDEKVTTDADAEGYAGTADVTEEQCRTAVKDAAAATREMPVTSWSIVLPSNYNPQSHSLLILFFSKTGALVDYWFRGDLEVMRSVLPSLVPKMRNADYAEIRHTASRELIFTTPQPLAGEEATSIHEPHKDGTQRTFEF